jgi:hypothetical protein
MRSWILIDIDKIDQETYNRLSRNRDVFLRPYDGKLAVPVDTELSSYALSYLRETGIPSHAMRAAEA